MQKMRTGVCGREGKMTYCNAIERQLTNYLNSRCHGRRNAKGSQVLAAWVRTNERTLRAHIKHLIEDHHIPICSTPDSGFFLPSYRSEADHTIKSLKSRIAETRKRLDLLEVALDEQFSPQMTLGVM